MRWVVDGRECRGYDVRPALNGYVDIVLLRANLVVIEFAVPTQEWDRVMNINLRGVMLCYKYAAKQMVEQGRGGRIIGACSASFKPS